jgi:4-alpha-glucanotransferase
MSDDAVRALAERAGLVVHWRDYRDHPQEVSPETLRAVLAAMGLDASSDAAIHDSEWHLAETVQAPDFVTGTVGEPFRIDGAGPARLVLEDGSTHDVDPHHVVVDLPGYHRLLVAGRSLTLAVAPHAAPSVRTLSGRDRIWGVAVQLYALRGEAPRGFGDFGALARFATSAAQAHADALAVSPAHALFAADSHRYSPYAPSSRDFLNILYGDPGGDAEPGGDALVDWPVASAARLERLRAGYARFAGDPAFDGFVAEQGEPLRLHALYEAIDAECRAAGSTGGWQSWPERFRDPAAPDVAAFAAAHADTVRFHLWLQWLADTGLEAAQAAARAGGMAVGLVSDLAVGLDPGGSHAWSRRDELIAGLTIGAPPDGLGPDGQGWGITGFSPIALRRLGFEPYLRTLRTALRHAGGVRIDHALGLGRLWVIPQGASPTQGCYMRYPEDDMLRLLALEAHRARALIVGEDLGTVPDGFRDRLAGHHLLGMSILPFERWHDGGFADPAYYRPVSAAMTSTHDLPPIAGWWEGNDLAWREKIGVAVESRDERADSRGKFWQRAIWSGGMQGDAPPPEQPERAVDAAIAIVAGAASELAVIPAEDLLGLVEAPNIPGTTDQHPNWRRRYPADAETLFADPAVARRTESLRAHRP